MLKKIIILKKHSHILRISLLWMLFVCSLNTLAQTPQIDSLKTLPKDSVALEILKGDTAAITAVPGTVAMDSLKVPNEKGDIATTIYYHAEDSIMMDVTKKKAYLYGKAQIKYQDMQLDAEQIEIEWEKNIITARGQVDSTGKYTGYPVWKQGADTYVTDSMRYNMKSEKGIIHGIVTKQGEGYLHGDTAKRTQEAIYLKNGVYTTCDLKHPHFYIKARRLKVIPEDKAVTGPFNIVIEDIQTPIGFWMGFFPITDKNKSGIIFPSFGENMNRGFSLTRGGYYWAVNDYLGIKMEADVYANGSWLTDVTSNYLKRYKYRGNTLFSLGRLKEGFNEDAIVNQTFKLNWQHATIAKRNGTLSANVNLTSSKYDKATNATPSRTNNNSTSSITYSRVFGRTPFSTSVSMRATQNVSQVTALNNASSIYSVTLPSATLTMNRINPLKRKHGDGNNWYEKIFVNYQGNFAYDLTNVKQFYDPVYKSMRDSTLQINQENLTNHILPNARWTSAHNSTIASTFKLLKVLNINPSINNYFNLYGKKYTYSYDNATNRPIAIDTANGLFATYYMNASAEMNTRIYGTWISKKKGMIQGLRHTLSPSVRMTYAPDFSETPMGGYTKYTNSKGEAVPISQHPSNPTPAFKQATLDFALINVLEAKVRNKKDTTGTKNKKINLLDNLSINGGYNFAADSLNMKNITLNTRTKLFGILDISLISEFDPYKYYTDSMQEIRGEKVLYGHRPINSYLISNGGPIAQLSSATVAIGSRFSPKKKTKDPKFDNPKMQSELDYIRANPNEYIDFSVPWNLSLNYNINYRHKGLEDPVVNSAITASGDISLTPKWKLVYSTGYNFKDKSITYSNFTISRDLHCWQMNMTLSPFGSFRTFFFTISAKSSMLQQLKMNKRSPNFIQ